MNRKLLPSLIALLTVGAAGVVNAADSVPVPTVYGKVNVTLNKYEFDDLSSSKVKINGQDNWQLESNASRLGVKGDIPLAESLKAVYKLEYEVFTDGSSSNAFTQRNTYAGLQGSSWGTIIAGKNDTPLKATTAETLQQFKDLPLGDFKYVMVGENRENNIIQYSTPNFSGFVFSAMLMPGEDSGELTDTAGNKIKNQNNGIADRFSVGATYKLDKLYLALADDQNVQNTDTLRFAAQYGIGPVTFGGVYQNAKRHDKDVLVSTTTSRANLTTGVITTTTANTTGTDNGKLGSLSSLPTPNNASSVGNPINDFGNYDSQDAYAVEAAWKIDKNWTLKGQYVESKSSPITSGLSDTTAKNYALGVDYNFTPASKVFAYYASIKTDGDLTATTSETLDDKTYAVGYELKF